MHGFTTRHLRRWASLILGLAAALPSLAQYTSDIDIYSGSSTSDPPNVLILLDNTANWNTAFTTEISAMVSTINALPAGKFRVGLMMFTETGNPNNNVDGGYVRSAIRTLDADNKTKFISMLQGLDKLGDKSNGGKAGKTMAEAYYYFTGAAPNSGNNKVKADYAGNTYGVASSKAIYALPNNALPSFAGSPYRSPIIEACARNYIIYISNGAVQDNNSDNTDASTRLTAAYAAASLTRPADITNLSPNGSQSNVADEWARFMKASPSNITTYTMDVDPITTGQGPGWSALLASMAVNSGGEYFAVSSSGTQIAEKLVSIFNQLQATDSVFSSASLPVSVNARGTYQNQVFMGMFRPDAEAQPRWRGNLKQYKFKYDVLTDTLSLADANNNSAISGATGFITPSAVSYWTTPSTFWTNEQMGTPPSASDSPDGEVVEKGGVAQLIRSTYATSQNSRNLYTCIGTGCSSGTNLATNNAAKFVTTNNSLPSTLDDDTINWVRGTNNKGENRPSTTPATTIRPSVHGDILHSRPAVVNYGGTTGVVVFYGANDGLLRAINGNQSGTDAGKELWGFLPEEHFGKLKRLRENSPNVRLSTTLVIDETSSDKPMPRDYFVDGPISVYHKVAADGSNEKVYLYFAMRRGGRFIYALDVTNPAEPKFLWRKSNNDTGFSALGQTWSEARVTKIKGNTNPVLIMGGGYDAAAEDAATPGAITMGNAVYVLDAFTGALLKRFDTTRSVPADVTLLDSDSDGYTDRAYAVDTGGNIYRIDLETTSSTAAANWGIYKLAALAGSGTRKFFYAPSATVTKTFTAVQVGSGDREKPLMNTSADTDRFFTVFDDRLTKGTPSTAPAAIVPGDLGLAGSTTADMTKGCYISMTAGEKVVNAATSFRGVTYFGTNKPTPSGESCSANLGEARTYAAPAFCQAPTSQKLNGGGLPPSPVAGFVTINYTQTNADGTTSQVTKQKEFVIGAPNTKQSGIEAGKATTSLNLPRKRRFWYQQNAR